MREIKFRAWDKKEKWMFPVEQWARNSWVAIPVQTSEEEWELNQLRMENIELMQFTGIKDKNGKEIFEGDIVKSSGGIYEVKWDMVGGFYPFVDVNCLIEDGIVEVIGNIYENPELIK